MRDVHEDGLKRVDIAASPPSNVCVGLFLQRRREGSVPGWSGSSTTNGRCAGSHPHPRISGAFTGSSLRISPLDKCFEP